MVIEIERSMEILISKSNRLLKELKKEADDIIIHASIGNYQQTKFANNKIVKNDSSISKSIYLFCNIKGKIIETTIKDTSEVGIKRTLNNIKKYSKQVPINEKFFGIAQGPFKYKKEKYDKSIEKVYEKHADIVSNAINSSLENGAERTGGVFETSYSRSYLLTSGNCEAEEKDSSVYLSIRALCEKESSGHKVYSSRTTKYLNPSKIAEDAANFAVEAKGEKKQIEGTMDVIFEPLPLAIILESIGHATSAFEVETGNSFLVDKLGKKVGSEIFTLIDDPTYEDAYIYSSFDAEGVPTKRKELIKEGILATYIHNTSTAKRYKTESTGNAGLINPHPWNVVLNEGEHKKEDLIKSVDRGIFVTNAWYMRFQNYFTGEFSILPRDATFYIEKGEIKYPIKNIRINSTLEEIMQKTKMIANNVEKIHSWEVSGSVITPSILVENIKITKPTN